MIYDVHLQYFARLAEEVQRQHYFAKAIEQLEVMVEEYIKCPTELRDYRMRKTLEKAIYTAEVSARRLMGEQEKQRAFAIRDSLKYETSPEAPNRYNVPQDGYFRGVIKTIQRERGFGFIKPFSGKEVFFHKSVVSYETAWQDLKVGDSVIFTLREDSQGRLRGFDVKVVPQ